MIYMNSYMFRDLSNLFWYGSPRYDRMQQRRGQRKEMGFLESIFSFVFGDGNPNLDFEERRWKMVGTPWWLVFVCMICLPIQDSCRSQRPRRGRRGIQSGSIWRQAQAADIIIAAGLRTCSGCLPGQPSVSAAWSEFTRARAGPVRVKLCKHTSSPAECHHCLQLIPGHWLVNYPGVGRSVHSCHVWKQAVSPTAALAMPAGPQQSTVHQSIPSYHCEAVHVAARSHASGSAHRCWCEEDAGS